MKRARARAREREREREKKKVDDSGKKREIVHGLVLPCYSILYLSHSLIPSSSYTIHSFVHPLLSLSLSFSLSPPPPLVLSLFLSHACTRKYARSFISSLSDYHHPYLSTFHSFDIFISLSLSLSPCYSLPSIPRCRSCSRNQARRSHSFPFLRPATSFPFPLLPPANLTHPQRLNAVTYVRTARPRPFGNDFRENFLIGAHRP